MTAPPVAGVEHVYSGKVRDLYRYDDGRLLMVASDRISAFDWVLPTEIPDKGGILTSLSIWWAELLVDIVPNHLLPDEVPVEVAGRAVVCEPLTMFPVECVVRGYLAGSGLAEYQSTGQVCGVPLPAGLVEGSALPEPVFTPATKAARGSHDENVDFDTVAGSVGWPTAEELRGLSLAVFEHASAVARDRGLILADTKFEFGARADGTIVLADEVLTPDSSRFWPSDQWHPGRPQPSYDKQFVREWLMLESGWDRTSGEPPPALPEEVVLRTRDRYVSAYEQLTGRSWP